LGKEGLVIVGGVAAGLAAAMEARRAAPDLPVTVFERTGDISYGSCGLPYVVAGLIPDADALVLHTPEYFRERHQIEVRTNCEALELLPSKSVVRVRGRGGEESEVGYDSLVLATGAAAVCPPLPGRELEGVFVLRHLRDGRRLLRFITEARPRAAVVVGAGYIGLEMAEAFVARGLRVTLVESSEKVMGALGGSARERVAEELRAHGVEVTFGERVTGFEGGGRVARVLTDAGRAIDADVVSVGVGVRPEVALAVAAGIEVGESGAVLTDERQRTSAPGVYAAGDCCEVLHRVSGRRVWHPLGQPAVRQGWVAGANAAGDSSAEARYAGVVGTNVVKVFGLEAARTGLSLEEALEAGFDAAETEGEAHSRAGYYPGGSKILTRLVTDARGRLLGAEMVGREGVAHRIDVYAAALHAGLKVEDVERLDLAYAPPFAPTIDPVIRAAHRARKKG
jgi:NADPH-dependent 2,4-dienoyl-CoA reductase/sulfur reductase-like enzyme